MRKMSFLFLIILLAGFWAGVVEARSYYYDSIKVEIRVNADSTFDVIEEQTYNLDGDFGFVYRDIEMKDLDHISDVEVFDSIGVKLPKSDYDLGYNGNLLHIQWNFPRRDFNNELKFWTIKYKVHGGLGFFDDYDEIYWNAISYDRDVPVDKAEVEVFFPEGVNRNDIFARMFIGELGNNQDLNSYAINDNSVVFSGSNIMPNEYLTIVVNWPKGFAEKPFFQRNQLINLMVILIAILLPVIIFIKVFRKWWKYGKDPKIKKTIIAQYEPPARNASHSDAGGPQGLAPAVMEVLLYQSPTIKSILATVIDLAVRGHIKIKEEEKKILFIKSKEYIFEHIRGQSNLNSYEQEIINALFNGREKISSTELRNKFYRKISAINKNIYNETAKTNLFNGNISEVRNKNSRFYFFGLIISIVGLFVFIMLSALLGLSLYIPQALILFAGLFASFVIGLIFSYQMPTLTADGVEAKWWALGFGEYLHTAERFRIEAETLETFSKFLPYAMIFGVEKQWANRFADFSYQNPSWYVPAYGVISNGSMSMSDFTSSFSSFADSIAGTFGSSPGGSGSGGGAGGGGGGGGGGAG